MKPSHDEELKNSLKQLNSRLQVKPEYQDRLRDRILIESDRTVTYKKKPIWVRSFLAAAIILFSLLAASPFYSQTMASLVEKLTPLEITSGDPGPAGYELAGDLHQLTEESGYPISSIGMTPDPFTIHITFAQGDASLSTMADAVEPAIRQHLAEQGIDQFELDIQLAQEFEPRPEDRELNVLMDTLHSIIDETFLKFGHPDWNQFSTYGISVNGDSYTLQLEIPDDLQEAEKIQTAIFDTIKDEELAIKDIEVRLYNKEQRAQEERWMTIAHDIYGALAGKSVYSATGFSYNVADGVSTVKIKSALSEQPDGQILMEIDKAIHEYLESEAIRSSIQHDSYRIQLLSEEKNVLLEVSDS